jgi:hypothetical protein
VVSLETSRAVPRETTGAAKEKERDGRDPDIRDNFNAPRDEMEQKKGNLRHIVFLLWFQFANLYFQYGLVNIPKVLSIDSATSFDCREYKMKKKT